MIHALLPLLLSASPACQAAAPARNAVQAGPEGSARAEEVLAGYRAALGAPEALAALGNLRLRGTATWVGLPGSGVVTEVYGTPFRARMVTEFEGFGRFEHGCDGATVWEKSPMETKARIGWDGSEFARRFGRARHADWREMYESAVHTGTQDLEGTPCHRLELVPKLLVPDSEAPPAPPPDVWLVEVETSLLRHVSARSVGIGGEEAEIRVGLDEWRDEDGVLFPHEKTVEISGFTLNLAYDSFERGIELPADYFALGEDVVAALERQGKEDGPQKDSEIVVEVLEPRHLASIRVTCTHDDMQKNLSVILTETMRHVLSSGGTMAGPPLVVYHAWGDEMDIEGAMPVAAPVEPKGRVKATELPGGECVVAWHVGPYDRLTETHERIAAFLAERELERRSAPWEEYWTDPGMEPDPSKWRTRVVYPVRPTGDDAQ